MKLKTEQEQVFHPKIGRMQMDISTEKIQEQNGNKTTEINYIGEKL